MNRLSYKKIFGIGPLGGLITIGLLLAALWIDRYAALGEITRFGTAARLGGALLVVLGLGLHGWSFMTLRAWWGQSMLCTQGPFRFFRHPMYAAWISLICPGAVLILNRWILLVWLVVVHVIWHRLVTREEATMGRLFGDTYRDYASRRGRFMPRLPPRPGD